MSNADSLRLGTLDHDIKGIEIIRYVAPIVVVKVATGNGTKPADVAVSADYTVKKEGGGRRILKGGVLSDCGFETQEDGRFRSEQLVPGRGGDGHRPGQGLRLEVGNLHTAGRGHQGGRADPGLERLTQLTCKANLPHPNPLPEGEETGFSPSPSGRGPG